MPQAMFADSTIDVEITGPARSGKSTAARAVVEALAAAGFAVRYFEGDAEADGRTVRGARRSAIVSVGEHRTDRPRSEGLTVVRPPHPWRPGGRGRKTAARVDG